MRLKVSKSIRGGEYFVTLQALDFNPEEKDKLEKFGSPEVDFDSNGLGSRKLENLEVSVKCESPEQAEEFVLLTKNKIKEKLSQLKDMIDTFSSEEEMEL